MTILFTQSTAVLHKYLNDELKILCLLQFFPQVAQNSQNSLSFPCSEKSLSIPGFQVWGHPARLPTDCQDQECETKTTLFETKTAIFVLQTGLKTKIWF